MIAFSGLFVLRLERCVGLGSRILHRQAFAGACGTCGDYRYVWSATRQRPHGCVQRQHCARCPVVNQKGRGQSVRFAPPRASCTCNAAKLSRSVADPQGDERDPRESDCVVLRIRRWDRRISCPLSAAPRCWFLPRSLESPLISPLPLPQLLSGMGTERAL